MAELEADIEVTLGVNRPGIASKIASEAHTITDLAIDEQVSHFVKVANGVVDQAISLGGMTTASVILIISDSQISLKVNGAATGIDGEIFLFTGAAITSISVSNGSGGTALVRVCALGS